MIQNQWYAILPSKAVKPGGITAVRRLSLDLALFRDGEGKLGCVVDQCTHRGAALHLGKVAGDCITCPFHGLAFDAGGACRFIPANGKANQTDNARYHIRAYSVREAHGIIYLWYGQPELATERLPFFDGEVESYVYSELADHWNTHYSRAIENQLDVVHLPFVHHNTIGRGHKTLVNGPKVIFEQDTLITSANNEVDQGQKPRRAEACEIKETHLRFHYPNLWMNYISDTLRVIAYFAPVDEENTILYIRFYNRITGWKPLDSMIAWIGKHMNRVIERQDRRVVITQRPKASAYRSAEKLLAGDGPIIEYRRRREQLMRP